MDIRSTLSVRSAHDMEVGPGVTDGQTLQRLVGNELIPTDRIRVALATYEPGTVEALHWHPIEAFYFVHAGQALVRDIEGTETRLGPGGFIHAPAGLAGAHEWEAVGALVLVSFRAAVESDRKLQFTVDPVTLRSHVEAADLAKRGGLAFPSHY